LASFVSPSAQLGDTNYTQFCKCGADFDSFLEKLGATRAAPRTDCDLDYEENSPRGSTPRSPRSQLLRALRARR